MSGLGTSIAMLFNGAALVAGFLALGASAADVTKCPGYAAGQIKKTSQGLTAKLKLNGKSCNTYGKDIDNLILQVEYQTAERLHVKIYDEAELVYQVPEEVLKPPTGNAGGSADSSDFKVTIKEKPFSFAVQKKSTKETVFDSSAAPFIFQSQYVRLRTSLPNKPNIYGLGEDTDAFRRNTTNYTRTLWSRDAYTVPSGTNLYGNHPIYFEHREKTQETHGVYLHNSNGMDIKINNTQADGQYLEYNTLGGVVDMYFLAGPGPVDVAKQYSDVVGKPAMMPYRGYGYHNCRYGYQDVYQLAEVVYNYSKAGIPLQTMWTDIDYMDGRKVFTLDPDRFPLHKMREFVDYLHKHDQNYIMMVDPAVAYQNYDAFNNGKKDDVFLKNKDGSIYKGVVWPGVTAFPDWFHPKTQDYWNHEFDTFFNADTGVDIDALWIDMNEASNFCTWPCTNPEQFAKDNNFPPDPPAVRTSWEPLPGFPPDFQPPKGNIKRQTGGSKKGLPGRNLIDPPYMIQNAGGSLSNHTIWSNLTHANGLIEYDTHNLYGTMMSSTSRGALLSRRPNERPMVITRSTFAGAGAKVGHWLGDNTATWEQYIGSIASILAFNSLYQVPMVGADVCGYAGNTTSTLCARWAMLGAFYPFYRNHNSIDTISQEFYRWPIVTSAARKAIKARYRLLDYFYTAFHTQTVTGAPSINALWFLYPKDGKTLSIDHQFFFGSSILVSPVVKENATDVSVYLPDDQFYDFWTYASVRGRGANVQLSNIKFDDIPVHIRGGSILAMRVDGANTTTALRDLDFELVIAPGLDGNAEGSLYLDDGLSLTQKATTEVSFKWRRGVLTVSGTFGYHTKSKLAKVTILCYGKGKKALVDGANAKTATGQNEAVTVDVNKDLGGGWTLKVE